jgi:hypothetical protein
MSGEKKLSELYPQYYKRLPTDVSRDEVDTYVINLMFPVEDPTGCILHARKKLLIPGVRSGGKTMLKDVKEARDSLNRYIALMEAQAEPMESGVAGQSITIYDTWYSRADVTKMPGCLQPQTSVDVELGDGTIVRASRAGGLAWDMPVESPKRIIKYRIRKA